jgi:nitrate/nitrite transporter NarK
VLQAELGFGPAEAGLLTTSFFLTMAVVGFPAGAIADRFGAKNAGAAGLALALLGNVLLGGARGFSDLLLLKALAAIGCATAFVAGVRYVTAAFPPEQVHGAQGLYGGCNALGGGTALIVMPMLYERFGWRLAFVISSAMVLVPLLAWIVLAPAARSAQAAARFSSVLGNGRVWLLGLVHGSSFGLSYLLGTWVTTYLVHDKGLAIGPAGVVGSAVLVGGIVSRPIGGIVLQRGHLSPWGMIRLSLAVIAGCTGVLATPQAPLLATMASLAVAGLALNLPFAATMHAIAASAPAATGAALGLASSVSVVFVAAWSPAIGALFAAAGAFWLPFGLLAAVCLAVLLLTFRRFREIGGTTVMRPVPPR